MTTSRKPVSLPKPKLTRAPAKLKDQRNPITTEIMQRFRRVLKKSDGEITLESAADAMGVNQSNLREWAACTRATPGGDNLVKIQRYLAIHDPAFLRDIFIRKTVKFLGECGDIRSKIPQQVIDHICTTGYYVGIIQDLSEQHGLQRKTIWNIRRRNNAQTRLVASPCDHTRG